jgi:hypothetical protein
VQFWIPNIYQYRKAHVLQASMFVQQLYQHIIVDGFSPPPFSECYRKRFSTAAKVNSIELFTHQYVFSSDPRSKFFLYIFLHYFAFYFHNYTTHCSYVNMISSNTLYSPRPWQYNIIRIARLCPSRNKVDDKLIKNKTFELPKEILHSCKSQFD